MMEGDVSHLCVDYVYVVCFGLHQSLQNREKKKKCASYPSKQIPKTKKKEERNDDGTDGRIGRTWGGGNILTLLVSKSKNRILCGKQEVVERQDDDYRTVCPFIPHSFVLWSTTVQHPIHLSLSLSYIFSYSYSLTSSVFYPRIEGRKEREKEESKVLDFDEPGGVS